MSEKELFVRFIMRVLGEPNVNLCLYQGWCLRGSIGGGGAGALLRYAQSWFILLRGEERR